MVAGYLLSIGSFWRIHDLLTGDPLPFVLNATIGNIIALAGSCFLMGMHQQINRMFHKKRKLATFLYLGSLFLTLLVAFLNIPGPKALILLILMIFQWLAVAWYCLSYVPFAHDMIVSYVSHVVSRSSSEY